MTKKVCTKCKESRPLEYFQRHRDIFGTTQTLEFKMCSECRSSNSMGIASWRARGAVHRKNGFRKCKNCGIFYTKKLSRCPSCKF